MMAGAFLGWQIPVVSLFVGSLAAIVLMVLQKLVQRRDAARDIRCAAGRTERTAVRPRFGDRRGGDVVRVAVARPAVTVAVLRRDRDGDSGVRHGGGVARRRAVPAPPGGGAGEVGQASGLS